MNLYKKPFPKKSPEDTIIDILRLNEQEFQNFRNVAIQWSGGKTFHDHLPEKPSRKLLPSALKTIQHVDQNTLAALMHIENSAHNDISKEYHQGGGLIETGSSILSGLWNMVGLGPEFESLFQTLGWSKPNRETPYDRYFAKAVQESYKSISKRDDSIGGGQNMWVRLPRFDNKKFSVWLDRPEKRVHVALKGTSSASDILSDASVILSNTSGHEKEISDYLKDITRAYGDNYSYDVSSHSLGSTELINVFQEDQFQLNKYDRINVFNPGQMPTHSLDNAKEAVKDSRFHFFLNSGDMLSNTFVSLVNSDSNVAWSDASHNPVYNHSIGQWVGDV